MKKLKNVLLSVAIILIAAGAAFATNTAKNTDDDLKLGYYYVESPVPQCIGTNVVCTTQAGDVCTWKDALGNTHELREFGSTQCGAVLYKPSMP